MRRWLSPALVALVLAWAVGACEDVPDIRFVKGDAGGGSSGLDGSSLADGATPDDGGIIGDASPDTGGPASCAEPAPTNGQCCGAWCINCSATQCSECSAKSCLAGEVCCPNPGNKVVCKTKC